MNLLSAVVLYLSLWFLTVFLVLPHLGRSQAEEGRIVPGTHAGAPANFRLKRMMIRVTVLATLAWLIIAGIILYSGISVHDIDIFNRMAPAAAG